MFWGFLHVALYISSSLCKFAQYIPLCGYTTRYLSIHLLKDMKFVSNFWLLQVKHLWTFMYKSLYEKVLLFFLSKYLGVQWLSCIVDMFNFLKKLPKCFVEWFYHSHSHYQFLRIPFAQHPLQHLIWWSVF